MTDDTSEFVTIYWNIAPEQIVNNTKNKSWIRYLYKRTMLRSEVEYIVKSTFQYSIMHIIDRKSYIRIIVPRETRKYKHSTRPTRMPNILGIVKYTNDIIVDMDGFSEVLFRGRFEPGTHVGEFMDKWAKYDYKLRRMVNPSHCEYCSVGYYYQRHRAKTMGDLIEHKHVDINLRPLPKLKGKAYMGYRYG